MSERSTARPYAAAAHLYRNAGWDAPIPVKGKGPPVTGFTGRDGRYPTAEEIDAWVRQRGGDNIALRLPNRGHWYRR